MGQGGVDPPTHEGNGFTARRSCRFATDPYVAAHHGLEPRTSCLTGKRSNQLSYAPKWRPIPDLNWCPLA